MVLPKVGDMIEDELGAFENRMIAAHGPIKTRAHRAGAPGIPPQTGLQFADGTAVLLERVPSDTNTFAVVKVHVGHGQVAPGKGRKK